MAALDSGIPVMFPGGAAVRFPLSASGTFIIPPGLVRMERFSCSYNMKVAVCNYACLYLVILPHRSGKVIINQFEKSSVN